MRRALLSVSDKTGLVEFARGLVRLGFEIVSTGGTSAELAANGVSVTQVADVTGQPEILGGRVKTLHPKIHGGILADLRQEAHLEQLESFGIEPFEVVCVNLYPFERTVRRGCPRDEAVENIDIGGPAMVRAAAKNHANVCVVVDPSDYGRILSELADGGASSGLKADLAAKAFAHTAFYDSLIARYLASDRFPQELTFGWRQKLALRYGENPHQSAALYVDPLAADGLAAFEQHWGKELSYNNLLDADAAWELVCDLAEGSCAIIKHGNPCGAASMRTVAASYSAARTADPVSAFGGIAAVHGCVDEPAALSMTEKGNFLEVVVGGEWTAGALSIFKERSGWGQDVRLLSAPVSSTDSSQTLRSIRGGVLVQDADEDPGAEFKLVSKRQPTEAEAAAARFAWKVVAHVKSNAIVVSTADRLLGVGTGQMNRVQSVRLALEQAGASARGAALASDAFFPFADSIVEAAKAGVSVIVQPGGSKKDAEVVAEADRVGICMLTTGVRHFRH